MPPNPKFPRTPSRIADSERLRKLAETMERGNRRFVGGSKKFGQSAAVIGSAAGRGFQSGKEKVSGVSGRVGGGIRDVVVKPEIIFGKGKEVGLIVLKWIVILVLLFVAIYFLYNWYQAGGSEKLMDNIRIWSRDNPVLQFFVQGLSRMSVQSLSGDVWTGEVDSNVNEDLGVKILEFRPYQDSFFPDDSIRLFGDIEVASLAGTSLDKGDKKVVVSCGLDEVGLSGTVIPDHFKLYPYYGVQVDCSFTNPGTYNQIRDSNEIKNNEDNNAVEGKKLGKSTIASLDVVYDFVTKAYLNIYLMDEKERMALRSKGVKDILKYYDINEKQPIVSQYTNGPVEIGMGVGRGENVQPIGIIDLKDPPEAYVGEVELIKQLNKKYVGITVKNRWNGEIVDLDLKLLLPKDMSLDSERLKTPYCPFVQVGKNVEWCKKIEDSRCYEIDPEALKGYYDIYKDSLDDKLREAMQFFKQERSEEDKQLFYPIKDFRTFYCFVDIGPEAYKQFTKVTYMIEADYKYHVSEDRTITFKGVEVDEGNGASFSVTTREKIVQCAEAQKGKPYVYGASCDLTNPDSFDCSSLVKYCYNLAGIENVPRVTHEQIKNCNEISKNNLLPGDLIFTTKNDPGHVGIYIGKTNCHTINAPKTGDVVKCRDLNMYDDAYYCKYKSL